MLSDILGSYWSYIVCGVILLLLIIHFVTEWDSVTYGVSQMFSTELVGLPTSRTNINRIKDIIKQKR